jgi:hypothetical protein
LGNIFTLDRNGQVTTNANKYGPKILSGVQDFEVTVNGRIYAVANNTNQSANAFVANTFDGTGYTPYVYKMFSNAIY